MEGLKVNPPELGNLDIPILILYFFLLSGGFKKNNKVLNRK